MKKLIALIIAACLIGVSVFLISTCEKDDDVHLSSKVQQKISAYRTDLVDSSATLNTTKAIKNYLTNWAEAKGIDYTVDNYNNVIMKVESSDTYKHVAPSVIVCGYDPEHFKHCIDPISVALYVAKNNEGTGDLTVIFTEDKNHNFTGIKKLNKKYFPDHANVFSLNGGSKNMWSTTTAATSTYRFTSNVKHTEPKGSKAYRISVEGLSGGIPDEKIASYPNPIKELGDLLAYFKTNSLIFELSEIYGGTSGNLYPKEASAVIVIDEDDQEKFEKRMTTAIENFKYPKAYTYKEVKVPKQVLSSDDMNKFISLLYTLVDGVYERDEDDEIISITNIGSIDCDGNTYTINASGNSLTEKGLNQIDLSYTTICGLSNIEYTKTSSQKGWSIKKPEEDPFVQQVSSAFKEYSDGTMHYRDNIIVTNCSYIYDKNPACNLMSITVNKARIEKYAGTIVTFLLNQLETVE